jgi:ABC-type branched-subunit amino acid transport system substrate-binding protein
MTVFKSLTTVLLLLIVACTAVETKHSSPQFSKALPIITPPSTKKVTPSAGAVARKHAQDSQTNALPAKAITPAAPTPVAAAISAVQIPFYYIQEADNFLKTPANITANPSMAESYRIKSYEIIEGKLTQDELKKVGDEFSDVGLRARAYYRLGQFGLENHDQDAARKYFAKSLNTDPKSDLGKKAQDLLSQLEAIRKVEPKTIGVVLPLTGRFASIAQKTLRGVEMGLGLYGNNVTPFKLAIMDSEGNPDTARRGVERLVKEDNAIAIIGSVLSKNSSAVAAKSAELGVPSITMAQKAGVTEISPTVFRNSLTSEMQVRHLVKTAMEEMGLKKFAVLYPNDQYGIEFTNVFWDEVRARGGKVTSAQSYSPKEKDFRYSIQRLVGTYYIEARADEYKTRLHEWSDQQKNKSGRNTPPDDLLPAIVDFDAIFIPDKAESLGQIAAMLTENGVKNVKLLGTNIWNVPDLVKRANNFAKDLIFVDTVSVSDPAFQSSTFLHDYKALFNEDPGVFEVQAYDSALILRHLISEGATSREGLTSALSRLNGLPGVLGNLYMNEDREVMRPVQAFTIDSGEIVPFKKQ